MPTAPVIGVHTQRQHPSARPNTSRTARVVANGDTANKIGTYALSIAAKHHAIPFFVAAPTTTLDPNLPSGEHIEIEQRTTEVGSMWRGGRETGVCGRAGEGGGREGWAGPCVGCSKELGTGCKSSSSEPWRWVACEGGRRGTRGGV